eukprot:jgi/Mesvir1/4746/Mv05536-RA.1
MPAFENHEAKKKRKAGKESNRPDDVTAEAALHQQPGKKDKKRKGDDVGIEASPVIADFMERKKKDKAQGADVAAGVEPAEGGEKKKKKKKQKKENEDSEGGRQEDAEMDGAGEREEPAEKKKKKKKNKVSGDEEAREGAILEEPSVSAKPLFAKVGHQELARSGRSFKKHFHVEHPEVEATSSAAVEQFRDKARMCVEGEEDFKPVSAFHQLGVPKELLHACRKFQAPTPIQSQCWPIVMRGRDLVGIAQTGSGKTLAFGLPALVHIKAQLDGSSGHSGNLAGGHSGGKKNKGSSGGGNGPIALVLSPTRELALQISEVMEDAGAACGVTTVCVYGGVPKPPQKEAIKKGAHIVVATPGRLKDLYEEGCCRLDNVTYLVLDEADRMLDLGFETLMFSATWPREVSNLADEYMARSPPPVRVRIGSADLAANHAVKQVVEVLDPAARDKRLDQLLRLHHKGEGGGGGEGG